MDLLRKLFNHKTEGPGKHPTLANELDREIGSNLNIGGNLARLFIDSKTTLLIMVATITFGLLALVMTPREENPQISVPAANVIVPFPGASPQEVENLVVRPLERLVWNIKGVEHVYAIAYPDFAVVTAQFEVGEDQEESVFKVFETIYANLDRAPEGTLDPLVKPVDINDVPIIAFTLFSEKQTSYELRQQALTILNDLRTVPGTSESVIVGGDERQIVVEIDPVKSSAFAVDPGGIVQALQGSNMRLPVGQLEHGESRVLVRAGQFLRNAEDVGSVVVATHGADGGQGEPVYLRDIARITDGPSDPGNISRISFGPHGGEEFHGVKDPELDLAGRSFNAVTVAIAKQKATNAVTIANAVLARMEDVSQYSLNADTQWVVTRNDGETANHAVNELINHLTWAIIIVVGLLVIFLGWRDSAVVAVAIPITMLTTLGIGMLAGQTINRITLFALILSLGLLVDDAIVVVENIHRHLKMRRSLQGMIKTCIVAVNEIANPTIYATLVVVVSMIPMAFVTGMMGPYMGPIPFNVPVAMIISLLVAFKITPYLSARWLKNVCKPDADEGSAKGGKGTGESGGESAVEDETQGAHPGLLRLFRNILTPLMDSRGKRNLLFTVLVVLLVVCFTFPLLTWVKFRMLPKANKNTFLITVDMPADSNLSNTDSLVRELEESLLADRHTVNLITTVGTGSVIDFNGLLRGTSFRNQPNQADIRVNIVPKEERAEASEDIVLRLRPVLREAADRYNAVLKLVEDPPGPPVRSTLLAEVYGPYGTLQRELVSRVRGWFEQTEAVVDIDDSYSTVPGEIRLVVDEEKALAAGLRVADVARALRMALAGYKVTVLHAAAEHQQTPVILRFPPEYRSQASDLDQVMLPGPRGAVPLSEISTQTTTDAARPVYHKDLRPVSYVYGEMARRSSVYANIDMMMMAANDPLPPGYELVWEGEWDLTLKVFRDLGIAMMVAMMLIYLILVGRFRSFIDPLVLMGAVPLMMLGVLPGFAIVGNWDVYFSATGMIGVIALAGIVTRNSIILIEFIQDAVAAGMSLKDAVIFAGAIRSRPIFLTAVTAMAGMLVMVTDPVWSGLSWSLLFGITASTPLSLVIIPLLYYAINVRNEPKQPATK